MDLQASGIIASFVLGIAALVLGVLFGNGYFGKEVEPSGFYEASAILFAIGVALIFKGKGKGIGGFSFKS